MNVMKKVNHSTPPNDIVLLMQNIMNNDFLCRESTLAFLFFHPKTINFCFLWLALYFIYSFVFNLEICYSKKKKKKEICYSFCIFFSILMDIYIIKFCDNRSMRLMLDQLMKLKKEKFRLDPTLSITSPVTTLPLLLHRLVAFTSSVS